MLILNLGRENSGWRFPLRLPATPADVGEAFAKLDEVCGTSERTQIAGTVSSVRFLDAFFRGKELPQGDALIQLNELARKIDLMTEQELRTFEGALNAECVNTLEEMLQVADSLNDYVFISGVTTEKELGWFLVDSGYKDFPEKVRPYLDYTAIGKEYLSLRGGAFTAEGYTLLRNSDGASMPFEKEWWPPLFHVCLQTGERWAGRLEPYTIQMPATPEKIQSAERILGVSDLSEAVVVSAECLHEQLKPYISLEEPDASHLQDMSVNLSAAMENYGEELVLAVFEAKKPRDLAEAGDLAISIDCYELVTDAEGYGRDALYDLCADDEIIDTVDGFMDWESFGRHMMEEDGLIPTDHGYLRLPEPEQPILEQSML